MKVLKVVGLCLVGLLGLVVLLYLIGVAVNWRDQPPSAAALEMKELLSNRPPVADADNGFVYLLGFSVSPPEDPQVAGALRNAWMESASRDPKQIDADPMKKVVDFNASEPRSVDGLKKSCGETHLERCRDAFLAALSQPRTPLEDLQLARYRALLQRPGWREVVPLDYRVPLPAYSNILDGQRLLMVDLAARARTASPSEIAAALHDDLEFWRIAQKSADLLITKIIAVAAIRQHFFFGSLVLREMPAGQADVIESWSVPFDAAELSMRRTMAGELSFAEGVMLNLKNGAEGHFIESDEEGLTLLGRIASSLARPFYQHQDQMNYFAGMYLDFVKRFEAPLAQYADIAKSLQTTEPVGSSFHVYNPVGHAIRNAGGAWTNTDYPIRVGSLEGMRRAALLTAQLRARGVPLEQMSTEVSSAELRNPFDGEPFEWSAEEQAVVYIGPDAERDHRRHSYSY